jgi:TRAP-type C4-dicarboxylate transport system permease large subunit
VVVIGRMDEGMSHLILLAVPLFVFLGLLIEMTGMARAMVAFLASVLGHVRGGLHYVLVGAMYLVSGISGSKAADMAAVAPVLFPRNEGARSEAGRSRCPTLSDGGANGDDPALSCADYHRVGYGRLDRGTVHWWAPARDRTCDNAVRSSLVAIPRRRPVTREAWRRLYPMLIETAALSGAILLIIGAATGMAWALTQSGFSASLAKFMTGLPGGVPIFLAVTIVAFVILGSVLEGIPAIVLFGPLLFPIARQVGVHDVHYAMVVILAMGIGLFAPPFGVGYYAACAISRINPDEGMKPIIGYMVALLIGTLIVAAVPWISTGFL